MVSSVSGVMEGAMLCRRGPTIFWMDADVNLNSKKKKEVVCFRTLYKMKNKGLLKLRKSLCPSFSAILNLDYTVVDLETLQALYENVSNTHSTFLQSSYMVCMAIHR